MSEKKKKICVGVFKKVGVYYAWSYTSFDSQRQADGFIDRQKSLGYPVKIGQTRKKTDFSRLNFAVSTRDTRRRLYNASLHKKKS